MNETLKTVLITIGTFLIAAANSGAYADYVELFKTETFFTDEFVVLSTEPRTFRVTLTDFEFPAPMIETGLNLTTATESVGSLMAPGTFIFEWLPTEHYYVNFFGIADSSTSTQLGQYGIEISQVPVPAAVWLFGSGLLGMIGIARRKKAA